MSLILAIGSNIGDKKNHLEQAKIELSSRFEFIACSRIYSSPAIEFTEQPDFYNQVLEFKLPTISPTDTMKTLLTIEEKLGRKRGISKGPRTIDIDIIFWGLEKICEKDLQIPHVSWDKRSFVVYPLRELPFFNIVKDHFIMPTKFHNNAIAIDNLYAV